MCSPWRPAIPELGDRRAWRRPAAAPDRRRSTHARATTRAPVVRPDLGLVGLDQRVERGRVDVPAGDQRALERSDPDLHRRRDRLCVISPSNHKAGRCESPSTGYDPAHEWTTTSPSANSRDGSTVIVAAAGEIDLSTVGDLRDGRDLRLRELRPAPARPDRGRVHRQHRARRPARAAQHAAIPQRHARDRRRRRSRCARPWRSPASGSCSRTRYCTGAAPRSPPPSPASCSAASPPSR